MIVEEDNYLLHYGILRKSGRYPWGSGGTQDARNRDFLSYVDELKTSGMSEVEIARGLGVSTTELRAAKSIAKSESRQADISTAQRMKERGMSNVAIAERMGLNESSVRALLAPGLADRNNLLTATSNMLRDKVAEKGYIDIGTGVENHLGISGTKLNTAVAMLREQGYTVHYLKVEQLGTGQNTTIKVLAGPDVSYGEVYRNRSQIQQVGEYSSDGGRSYLGIRPPTQIDPKRVAVKYAEDGGADADGVIYVRRGVDDVSLGGSRYAQVRIAVGGTHYLKGMAMYSDDLPDGVDLLFNTNKTNTGNNLDAMKKLKDDPESPFGAIVRQREYDTPGGKKLSAMNIVNEEGSWEGWSRSLSSQMLSKQSPVLAAEQLAMARERRQREFEEINSLTNPAVKKKLLESFADDADSAAVHLKAAALPRQGSHVILPINSMKETEVYAPNYRDGERVVLIRYPHGGVFEIPELTVNNKHPAAKNALGNARDAIGINSKVAQRLSGADFDGDTVLVIPNDRGRVRTAPALAGLKGFDPQSAYPAYEGMPKMSARTKQIQMGDVSNLITDMTIRGASSDEIARAVRHSMVVIDAEKHNLNWRQSSIDNGIAQLKRDYQGSARSGASTLVSRATSQTRVLERKPRSAANGGSIDAVTGKKMYELTGTSYVNAKGETVQKTARSAKLAETDNAFTLSSGTVMERVYAEHSNDLKNLANQARRQSVNIKPTPYSPTAKTTYAPQVESLNAKLNIALRNAPLERQAQLLANVAVTAKKQAHPDMDSADLKKIKAQELNRARIRTAAKKTAVEITPSEWEAIQAGAISNNKLTQILNNTDIDRIKELATPRTPTVMTGTRKQRAATMIALGYTQSEIADALGVSVSTLKASFD